MNIVSKDDFRPLDKNLNTKNKMVRGEDLNDFK